MRKAQTSVVITSFNQKEFITEAVDSALGQKYAKVEVIVVDDGSDDGTQEHLRHYFGNTINLILQHNQGPSAAVNSGILAATGEFISFLGGDDICFSNRVSEQVLHLESTSTDVVFCVPKIIDFAGKELSAGCFSVFEKPFDESDLLRVLLTEGNFLCAPSATLRREVFSRVGLFRLGFVQLQDYEFWIRCSVAGVRMSMQTKQFLAYRRHAANLSATGANAAQIEEALILETLIEDQGAHSSLRKVFKNLLPPVQDSVVLLTELDKVLLSLGHRNKYFQSMGAMRAIKAYEFTNFREEVLQKKIIFPAFLRNCLSE